MKRRSSFSLLALLASVALGFPVVEPATAQEVVDTGRPIRGDASIKVWNGAGSVRVEAWDADSLAVTGTGGRFFLHAEEGVAKLGTEGGLHESGGDLIVRVPRAATVWVRTGSADVVIRGLRGTVDVHSVSGAIDVSGRPGQLYAESMGGDLVLDVTGGIARAKTATGGIAFTGSARDLNLSTVSGDLQIDAGLLRGRFDTVDGELRFTGTIRTGGSLSFETHSGDVRLRLPSDFAADFELSTFEGEIRAPFAPGATPAGTSRRTLRFTAGAGQAEVTVRSYSGSIVVEGG